MKDIYTTPEVAAELLASRRQDLELKARAAQYLGNVLPAACFEREEPLAFLARYVPRATGEDRLFAEVAQEAGFVPYWASYVADRFTTRNPEKVETIRPPINWQKGQRTRGWVVDADKRDGGIGNLQTKYGYSSLEFQKGVRQLVLAKDGQPELVDNTFDMGGWYKTQAPRFGYVQGNLAPFYYPATMALATTFGVLYEDFDGGPNAGNGDLTAFRNEIVYPAIDKVEKELGVRPIIVQLPYEQGMNETDLSFLDYEQAEQFKKFGSLSLQSVRVGM